MVININNHVNVIINSCSLKVDTYKSSGPGGQHVNVTNSAVRITHLPSKIVIQCQNYRSQHKNKQECISILKSRLYNINIKNINNKLFNNKYLKNISWSRQIRSYVLYPYKLVNDNRILYKTIKLHHCLYGYIDNLIYKTIIFFSK